MEGLQLHPCLQTTSREFFSATISWIGHTFLRATSGKSKKKAKILFYSTVHTVELNLIVSGHAICFHVILEQRTFVAEDGQIWRCDGRSIGTQLEYLDVWWLRINKFVYKIALVKLENLAIIRHFKCCRPLHNQKSIWVDFWRKSPHIGTNSTPG